MSMMSNSMATKVLATLAIFTSMLVPYANAETNDSWLHSVRPGDSFNSICQKLTADPKSCEEQLPGLNKDLGKYLAPGMQVTIPVAWLKTPPAPAEVELVRGQAFLEEYALTGDESVKINGTVPANVYRLVLRPLKAGATVKMGDKLVTQEGNVLIRFADDSTFLLRANSELILQRLSAHGETGMVDTHLRLQRGSGRARVNSESGKSRYKVSTPAAIAAARGTDFSISAGEDGSLTLNEVLEGRVALEGLGESRSLDQGWGAVAKAGEAPSEPVELLDAPKLQLGEEQDLPFTLRWKEIADAQSYTIDVYEGEGTNNLYASNTVVASSGTALDFEQLESGTYTFVARAVDQLGLRGLEAVRTTVATERLHAPKLSRRNIRARKGKMSISWEPVELAKTYIVEVSDDEAFSNILASEETDASSLALDLPEKDLYYARISSVYGEGKTSQPSAAQEVNTQPGSRLWQILQSLGFLAIILA